MTTINRKIQNFVSRDYLHLKSNANNAKHEEQIAQIVQLFFVHVYLEAFFFFTDYETNDPWSSIFRNKKKFIRCQGVHAFKNEKHIPLFLKKAFVCSDVDENDPKSVALCNEIFSSRTDPIVHSERVLPEFFESVPQIQDMSETLQMIQDNKTKDHWVPVVSKSHVKDLKRRLNRAHCFDSWDACHEEFVKNFTFTGAYDYYYDYIGQVPDMTTKTIPIWTMIDLLESVQKDKLVLCVKFLNHFGEFNPKKLFGINEFKFTELDIRVAFRNYGYWPYFSLDSLDDSENTFPCKCKSRKQCQNSPHSHLFIKDVMTKHNIHLE